MKKKGAASPCPLFAFRSKLADFERVIILALLEGQ
jgi:hypothetical protein